MGERTFVTLIDASKNFTSAHRPLETIEKDVTLADTLLANIDRDILGLEEARKVASLRLQNLRNEFHEAVAAKYPGVPRHGRL